MKKFLQEIFIKKESRFFKIANIFLTTLIIISVLSLSLETVQELKQYEKIFVLIEVFSIFIFTLEYIGRLYISKVR
jgi:formate hydrogenlyase subunit 4